MTFRSMRRLFLCLFCSLFALAARGEEVADFAIWLEQFKQEALAAGISQATLDAALGAVEPLPEVMELDRRQPEFFDPFLIYLEKRVSPLRLEKGQALLNEHQGLLEKIQARYGVPANILVAFWGLETNYGSYLGNHPVPAALASLAFDPRRSTFFRNELLQALRIIEAGHISAADMKGSWAGAMGQVQFMPSTYLRHAVDGDADGRKDLWNSLPDALNSAANFLQRLGWQPGELWGREVRLPEGFAWELARTGVKKPVDAWTRLGVTQADGSRLPSSDMLGAIVLPQGHAGPAFLIYRNFDVIMAWNRSLKYALAVGHLADRLIGKPPLQGGAAADNRPMRREQVMQLQQFLAQLGLDVGEPDGVAGPRTRQAIRAWQKSVGLPVDGYASLNLLEQLQTAIQPDVPRDPQSGA